jgi:hypothetical protein
MAGNNSFTGGVDVYNGTVLVQNPCGSGGYDGATPGLGAPLRAPWICAPTPAVSTAAPSFGGSLRTLGLELLRC